MALENIANLLIGKGVTEVRHNGAIWSRQIYELSGSGSQLRDTHYAEGVLDPQSL